MRSAAVRARVNYVCRFCSCGSFITNSYLDWTEETDDLLRNLHIKDCALLLMTLFTIIAARGMTEVRRDRSACLFLLSGWLLLCVCTYIHIHRYIYWALIQILSLWFSRHWSLIHTPYVLCDKRVDMFDLIYIYIAFDSHPWSTRHKFFCNGSPIPFPTSWIDSRKHWTTNHLL